MDDVKAVSGKEKGGDLSIDMSFLGNIKTMESSIITLDHRERFSKMKHLSDIGWRKKEENAIRYIKNEVYVDVEESDSGGIINICNQTTCNVLKVCVKIRCFGLFMFYAEIHSLTDCVVRV